jgi:hypothetical protein
MQCNELESVLAGDDLDALSAEATEHLAGCSACRDLVADLSAIVVAAKHIPAEVNPPERVWVALRAQLEAEGIIREPQIVKPAVTEASWWAGLQHFFRPRVLATVAATLFVAAGGIYISQHRGRVIQNNPSPAVEATKAAPADAGKPVEQVSVPAPVVAPKRHDSRVQMAHTAAVPPQPIDPRIKTIADRKCQFWGDRRGLERHGRGVAEPRSSRQCFGRCGASPEPAHLERIHCGMSGKTEEESPGSTHP